MNFRSHPITVKFETKQNDHWGTVDRCILQEHVYSLLAIPVRKIRATIADLENTPIRISRGPYVIVEGTWNEIFFLVAVMTAEAIRNHEIG